MSEVVLIAALARGRVIGVNNTLPWHLPEDMAHFRNATRGHPVVMGRKTWDSLPPRFRPLPGRRNVVVTRNTAWQAEGAEVAHGLQQALALAGAGGSAERVFVIGGAELYAAALPLAHTLLLTEIEADIAGDAHFPAFEGLGYTEVARERHQAAPPNTFAFSFVTYRRNAVAQPGTASA